MRAAPALIAFALATVPAFAGPFHADRAATASRPILRIPDLAPDGLAWRRSEEDSLTLPRLRESAGPAPGGLTLGPLHAEGEMVNGRRRLRYRLDGFGMLGGDVGGSLGGRGAEIFLRWPPHD